MDDDEDDDEVEDVAEEDEEENDDPEEEQDEETVNAEAEKLETDRHAGSEVAPQDSDNRYMLRY